MQDLRLVFKRDIKQYVEKDLCRFPFDEKNEVLRSFQRYRALGMCCIFRFWAMFSVGIFM